MTTTLIADVEGALRTWLRTQPDIAALVGGRVFFAVPDTVVFPCITLRQVGGGLLTGDTPMAESLIQFDCFGEGRNKAQAAQLQLTLVSVLNALESGTQLDAHTKAFGAVVSSVIFLPDPTTQQARYAVTASVSAQRVS